MEKKLAEISEKFAQDLAEVDWKALRIHLQRDALILVDEQLDLIEVACRVANDDATEVGAWIAQGRLAKPAAEQLSSWETQLDKPFRMLIAAPYILVQEVRHA